MRNETLDTSFYALAAAHLMGLSRIKWKDETKEVNSVVILVPVK